jgi:chromate transporter
MVDITLAFFRLGCLSFGGPIAHLGYLHADIVRRRQWIDEAGFSDLVALCQFLPGPASSQVVFGLGMHRAGLPGALAATFGFTLPSALLMIGFALGAGQLTGHTHAGWLAGLQLAAVTMVAQAVWSMGERLCPDWPRLALCFGAAVTLLTLPGTATQLAVLVTGGLFGWLRYRTHQPPAAKPVGPLRLAQHPWALATLAVHGTLLLLLPWLATSSSSAGMSWSRVFAAFYRSGALAFGGAHVLLPLLRDQVVPTGWLDDGRFLAGYGAAQALPGPLFTFSAYLGTAMDNGPSPWWLGLWCLLALFLPSWLQVGGMLPFWQKVRRIPWMQATLQGTNAAVVGLLLAALYDPIMTESLRSMADVAAVLVAFAAVQWGKVPAWAVVGGLAGVGQWVL